MEQLNVLMQYTVCAAATFVFVILLPFGVHICAKNGKDRLGRVLAFFWVEGWIFATVFVYNAIFG